MVEGGELIHQVDQSRDLALRVVTHDLPRSSLRRDLRVGGGLAVDEAVQAGSQRAIGNGGIVGRVGAEELEVVAGDRVVRVMQNRVKVLVDGAVLAAVRFGHIQRVAERPVVDDVVEALAVHATEDVVKGAVLQQDPDNVLDLVLQVGDGLLGTRLVAPGLAALLHSCSDTGAAQAQNGCESAGLHGEVEQGTAIGLLIELNGGLGFARVFMCRRSPIARQINTFPDRAHVRIVHCDRLPCCDGPIELH